MRSTEQLKMYLGFVAAPSLHRTLSIAHQPLETQGNFDCLRFCTLRKKGSYEELYKCAGSKAPLTAILHSQMHDWWQRREKTLNVSDSEHFPSTLAQAVAPRTGVESD